MGVAAQLFQSRHELLRRFNQNLSCGADLLSEQFAQNITHGQAALLSLLIKRLHRLFIDLYFVSAMPELRFYRYGFEAVGVIGSVVSVPKLRRFLVAGELVWNRINLLPLVAHNI